MQIISFGLHILFLSFMCCAPIRLALCGERMEAIRIFGRMNCDDHSYLQGEAIDIEMNVENKTNDVMLLEKPRLFSNLEIVVNDSNGDAVPLLRNGRAISMRNRWQ